MALDLRKKVIQRTLVLIKPDGVQRGLVGEIISRFERAGLKIVGLGIVRPKRNILEKHYPKDKEWIENLGRHTFSDLEEMGIKNPLEFCKAKSLYDLGLKVRNWLIDFMLSGPIVKIALEGPRAIEVVRKIVGFTIPAKANPGTIRGDFSSDVPFLANLEERAVKNLIHASSNEKEAETEISLWFKKDELIS
jgi:nucleoside-diphosphate kinase